MGAGPQPRIALSGRAGARHRYRELVHAHADRTHRTPVPGRVITVSDRAAAGTREDTSGPLAAELLAAAGVAADVVVVPDEVEAITGAIQAALDGGARVIVTTGGTGVGPRDVTPEATAPLLARALPGVAEAIRARGAEHQPAAVLSRGLAGVTAGPRPALVVNAPGSPDGVRDALTVLAGLVPHVLDQLGGGDHY